MLCVWQQRLAGAAVHRKYLTAGQGRPELFEPGPVRHLGGPFDISYAQDPHGDRLRHPEGEIGKDGHGAGPGQAPSAIRVYADRFQRVAHQ